LGVIENMAWYENKAGEKEFVFGQGGGPKLADELRTTLLGQIPLGQPDWTEEDFAPSIYAADHPTGKIYLQIAQGIIDALAK
ncbi:MAG TPA: P-loop NTPase, partial [Solibacillus sp.]